MKLKRVLVLAGVLLDTGTAVAAGVDGLLDESGWAGATVIENFQVVDPYTLAEPPQHTRALLYTAPDGLHIGVIADQADVPAARSRTARDSDPLADRIAVYLDFEGKGATGYGFLTTRAGAVVDNTITNQNVLNPDWDATWYSAVRDEGNRWTVETLIPWNVAPMGAIVNGEREIGMLVTRMLQSSSVRQSAPPVPFNRPTFLSEFGKYRVQAWDSATLDVFPYVAARHDFLTNENKLRAGLDVFWKPASNHQFNATLNPDFGQVESDDLVVNFTAIETFFSDKRPFFTENSGLFRIEGQTTQIVNTRRIGREPDAGSEGSSDIIGAVKYTGNVGNQDFGLFTAFEDDSAAAQGRNFYVGRARHRGIDWKLGYLGWLADSPTLNRQATAHTLDYEWIPGDGISLNGYLSASHISDRPDASNTTEQTADGLGGFARLAYNPGNNLEQYLTLTRYGRNFELNDLGFLERNNLAELASYSYYYLRDWAPGSVIRTSNFALEAKAQANGDQDYLASSNVLLGYFTGYKSGANSFVFWEPYAAGTDDLLTRGNGKVQMPHRDVVYAEHYSPQVGWFRWLAAAQYFEDGLPGRGWSYRYSPNLHFTDSFDIALDLRYTEDRDWLIWIGGNRLGSFARTQTQIGFNLNWYPGPRHELRLKTQWIGLKADALRSYVVQAERPLADNQPLDDFTLSNLALQLRYRYELAALSELYLVYSRGGFAEQDDAFRGNERLFRDSLDQRTADQVLLKLRYRFTI